MSVWAWRTQQIRKIREENLVNASLAYYGQPEHAAEFILHWVDTYDPRNAGTETPPSMPFIMFQRQMELVEFLMALIQGQESGLIEKARDMGATYVAAAVSVWLWLFMPGAAVGWGSRKEELVDKKDDPKCIFQKIRDIVRSLPPEFLPPGFDWRQHSSHMKLVNPANGASIVGEAGDNIGRGGRTLIYFKDESAHYERPVSIEAALGDNTNVQVDISSVKGLGNVFHRRREAGIEWKPGQPAHKGYTNVFVMDWSDHPAKTHDWYVQKRDKMEREGLAHVFAQEVDRDYSAAVEGVIVPAKWVAACIDAHIKLGWPEPDGRHIGGMDVADEEGADRKAVAIRQSYLLKFLDSWAGGDTGDAARKAIRLARPFCPKPSAQPNSDARYAAGLDMQYDSVGVGAGVKTTYNQVKASGLMPEGLAFIPWSAGAGVLNPDGHIAKRADGSDDKESPTNKDFYANLKAQAWWEFRLRVERTFKAVTKGEVYPVEDMISFPSDLPNLATLRKQLSQPTISERTGTLKLVVDKTPEGTKSPDEGDAVVMAYWPIPAAVTAQMFLRKNRRG